jgi:hypothetical protein
MVNNDCGVQLEETSGNIFYHNNVVANTFQVSIIGYAFDTWDDGHPASGNYWDDYASFDLNHDGTGDTEHVVSANNIDRYPLMGPFHSFNTSKGYAVDVISNSSITDFEYFASNSTIRMYVSNTTSNQTFGFCRVRIPRALMNETVPIAVLVNGTEPYYWNYTLYDDGNNRWIYFEYEHSALEIVIIPEFPSFIFLQLFMMATILLVMVYKKVSSLPKDRKEGLRGKRLHLG